MANVIKHKRGSGSDPAANNLVVGELAIRTDTGKLFTKMDSGAIAEIAGGGSDIAINTLSASSYSGGSGASSFNGSENRFTLSSPPNVSAAQLLVSVNGVIQKPVLGTGTPSEGFSVNGNDIIFSSPPETGADFFILTFRSLGVSEPADNSVTSAKIVDGAIVNADINASAAIAGTKISPDFGSQNIATTGNLGITFGSQTYQLRNDNGVFKIRDATNSVDRLQIAANGATTLANTLTVGNTINILGIEPSIAFTDSNHNPDYYVQNIDGLFRVRDNTNNVDRIQLASNGAITLANTLTVGGDITSSTGDLTLSAGSIIATDLIPATFKNNVTGTSSVYVLIGNNTQTYAFQASSNGFSINDYTNVNVARFSINSSGNCTAHNDLTVSGNLAVTTQSQFNNAVTINSGLFVGGSSVSGGEGGQIELTQAPTSTLAGSNVIFDTVVNSIRFFESASPFKGAILDLSTCATGVGSQIMTSTTAVTYTGAMTFGSGATIDLSTNDVYLNARVINNQTGGTDDGLYLGFNNVNSGTTKIFGGGSTTHHFVFDATNFIPGTDSHSSLGTSTNTWLNLFADTVNVTGPGSTTLKLTTAAGAVDVVSLDTSHASSAKPDMHFKLQGTPAFIIDRNHNINMGGSLAAGTAGRYFDIYNLGTDTNSFAISRLITFQQGSGTTTTGEIIKFRNGDLSIRNNEPSGFNNINFYTATSAGSHEAARFISDKGFLCSRNTPGDQGLVDPGVIFDRADSRVGTNFNTFNGVGIMKDSNAWATALYIMRTEAGCGQGYFIEFAFRTTAGAQNTIGRIENNGATNVLYTTYSDYRLKQDVAPITDAISRIKTLKPIKFRWKDDLEMGYQDGFIAHEVEETNDFKYLISGKKDATRKKYDNPEETEPDYQGIDYAKFTPILISALQEAVAKIETLETKVAALEAG
jgi:hypothetical protein